MYFTSLEPSCSFLHAKVYGEHNHLVGDPWSKTDCVYWVSAGGHVYRLTPGHAVRHVWAPGHAAADTAGRYNPGLVMAGRGTALVSDGAGRLDIVTTGDRDTAAQWSSVFSELVCGENRPFLVVGAEEGAGQLEAVLQYVEERPGPGGGWANTLEWVTFSRTEAGLMMERVRRLETSGGLNLATVISGRLVISGQKSARLVFDSTLGDEEDITDADMEAAVSGGCAEGEAEPELYWRQTAEDVEVWCYTGEVSRARVQVSLERGRLQLEAGGRVLAGELLHEVEADTWTWTLGGGKLAVTMTKQVEAAWAGGELWTEDTRAASSRAREVTEDNEDAVLAHLTSDQPMAGTGAGDGLGTWHTEQLEECDDCEDTDTLSWLEAGAGPRLEANMAGHQHLATVMEAECAAPSLVTRHDVDGLVWRLGPDTVTHVATFPALGYVQASKTCRKFVSAPATWSYSAICDNSRHVYIYRQPQALAEETELRNRRSGQRVAAVARQQVVTLDTTADILGLAALPSCLVVLTRTKLYTCHL